MENITPEQALAGGISIGMIAVFGLIWFVIQVIAYWKIFDKAGKPGWHCIIPVLNIYDQFDICWKGIYGIVCFLLLMVTSAAGNYLQTTQSTAMMSLAGIAGLIFFVIYVIGLYKLSRSFGHGALFTLGLIFFQPIFMLILGFGSSQYYGKPE